MTIRREQQGAADSSIDSPRDWNGWKPQAEKILLEALAGPLKFPSTFAGRALKIFAAVKPAERTHGFWPARHRDGSFSVKYTFRPSGWVRDEKFGRLPPPNARPMISEAGEIRLPIWLEGLMMTHTVQFDGTGLSTLRDLPPALIGGGALEAAST